MPTPEVLNRPIADPMEILTGQREDPALQLDGPAPPPAVIRPFDAKTDLKLVRYLIGAVAMEPSSLANQAALLKPVSLAIWLGSVHLLVTRFTSGYPAMIHNRLYPSSPKLPAPGTEAISPVWEFVVLLPLVAAPVIAVLAAFEWRHRNLFEAEMRRAIGEEDLRDIETYYGVENQGAPLQVGASHAKKEDAPRQRHGFWVLEFDNRMLGAVALDGRKPGQPLDSVVDHLDAEAGDKGSDAKDAASAVDEAEGETTATGAGESRYALRSRGKSGEAAATGSPKAASGAAAKSSTLDSPVSLPEGTLHLRRFGTSLSFRPAGIDDDLLQHAAKVAFSPPISSGQPSPAEQIVFSLRPSVQVSLRRQLQRDGWELVPKGSPLEISANPAAAKERKSFIDPVWPLNLGERTMVLKRSVWEKKQAK